MFFKKKKKSEISTKIYSNPKDYNDLLKSNVNSETTKINLDSFDLESIEYEVTWAKYSNCSVDELVEKLNNENLSIEEKQVINHLINNKK